MTEFRGKAWLTRADFQRAGDLSQPVHLDHFGGLWWILEPPTFDMHGRIERMVEIRTADQTAVQWVERWTTLPEVSVGAMLDSIAAERNIVRNIVKLATGERQPFYALDTVPEGYRLETDAEFRARVTTLPKAPE